jgi:dipeptidyl aminopeptidase/acylaminoacyl peptidase
MWKRRRTVAVIFLAAISHGIDPAIAQATESRKQPLAVEHTVDIQRFAHLMPISLSPDGEWAAYTVQDIRRARSVDQVTAATTGTAGMFTGTDIWIANTATGQGQRLTSGEGDNFFPVWSPDGRYLAFLSDRDGSHQARVWIWNVASKQLKKVRDLDIRQFGQLQWMPDSRQIIVPIVPAGMSVGEYVRKRTSVEGSLHTADKPTPGSTVAVYKSELGVLGSGDRPRSDPWSLDIVLRDLASVDVASGNARVIVHGCRIAVFHLSPDGSRIAYSIPKRFATPGSQQILYDLAVLNLSTMQERIVATDAKIGWFGEFSWSPDSLRLSYCAAGSQTLACQILGLDSSNPRNAMEWKQPLQGYASPYPLWDKDAEHVYYLNGGSLWRVGLKQSTPVEIARIPNREITQMIAQSDERLWSRDGGKSTVVVTHDDSGKQDGFYQIDLTSGESAKLRENGECYTCANTQPQVVATEDSSNLLYLSEDAQHGSNLWIASSGFERPRQLTRLNPEIEDYELGKPRLIDWLSDDGERLHGTLLLPSGYSTGDRYPLVVVVYGGGYLSNGFNRFGGWSDGPFNMQLLATRGYAVLLPDVPLKIGTPMLDIAKDVLPGVNKLIEMGIVDAARLGVIGQSYGGYSTLSLLVLTQRFKAAVDIDGPANLISLFGEMNAAGAAYQTGVNLKLRGTPWDHRDDYIENSPLFYLDRVKTPLLIVHGGSDSAVAPSQGDEVFVGLRRLEKTVEYARYAGEDHSPLYWSYPNQLDYCRRMIAWFETYLKPGNRQDVESEKQKTSSQ